MNARTYRLSAALGILFLVTAACATGIQATTTPKATSKATTAILDPNSLVIATSPEIAPLLGKLADQFNAQQKGKTGLADVKITTASPGEMVVAALNPDPPYHAINPDSSIWLSKLSNEWGKLSQNAVSGDQALPIPRQRYALPQLYAVSPVVIAMWETVAKQMDWPAKAIGWTTLQERVAQDPNFHWNHPSTDYASGLLATLAEFYAAAGVSRGLTEAQATDLATLDYVKKVEGTVRFYGEGESAVLDRLKKDGPSLLDAFVAQEQIVLRWNSENPGQTLVAVYPVEGSLWADHPLALLERYPDYDHSSLTNPQRDAYYAFTRYLVSVEAQKLVLVSGFRPVSLAIDLQGDGSPFKSNPSVNALQPKTTLQIPAYSVVQVIEDYRSYIKKPTNVILVVDTSGSMNDANKLPKVKTALLKFIANINGKKDRLGLIDFSDHIKYSSGVELVTADYMDTLTGRIQKMQAEGNTAVLDSVLEAYNQLSDLNDSQAINAIVVMTDGKENASVNTNLDELTHTISSGKAPVVVFSIAFGKDADTQLMEKLASATNGQFRQADSFNIEDLYKIISTYF